ncbi:MAG: glycoside hydrolase family 92 protein, partial [Paramuribaculum sp.]|nr:glycoside hydrolase family 92 protein [Paramuribaculum sp.]
MKINKYAALLPIIAAGITACGSVADKESPRLTDYVDPMIGTGGHGHVFLGANVPFGMVQLGPSQVVKGWDWCSGYHYSD